MHKLNLPSWTVKPLSLHTLMGHGEQAGPCLQLPFTFQKSVAMSFVLQVKPLHSLPLALFPGHSSSPRPFPGLTPGGPCLSRYGAHSWTRRSLRVLAGSEESRRVTSPVLQDTLLLTELHLTSAFFTTAWYCWLIFSLWLMTSSGSFFCKLPPKPDYRINCCCNVGMKKKINFQTVRFWVHAIHMDQFSSQHSFFFLAKRACGTEAWGHLHLQIT